MASPAMPNNRWTEGMSDDIDRVVIVVWWWSESLMPEY
jgi:hypothetical protein